MTARMRPAGPICRRCMRRRGSGSSGSRTAAGRQWHVMPRCAKRTASMSPFSTPTISGCHGNWKDRSVRSAAIRSANGVTRRLPSWTRPTSQRGQAPRATGPSCLVGSRRKCLNDETVIALPSVVVARRLLEQLGAFDEGLVMCEDDELWLRLAVHGEIDGIDEPLTLVRRHAQHSGSDIIAWRDRRRVFEKLLRSGEWDRFADVLRRQRAEMAAGLATSQAMCGLRLAALGTVLSSSRYSWTYPQWWHGALAAVVRALAPAVLRRFARRFWP